MRRLLLALLVLTGCARTVAVAPPAPPGTEETGYASWYGHPYHGRRTASGEVYDMNDMTAAHRTLPLGTRLLVTNLDTGQAVEVRVNDRGPFVDGRILDLSWQAARVVGALGPGVIPVRLRVVGLPGAMAPAPSPAAGPGPVAAPAAGGFSLQIGAFTSLERAEALRRAVAPEAPAAVTAADGLFRVRVGPYPTRAAAESTAERLAALG